ncbi:MAG: hypothetical protein JWO36_1865 [Myxococcales bacterium]|nr:hypothetical protein [Myxococcales bacterium]
MKFLPLVVCTLVGACVGNDYDTGAGGAGSDVGSDGSGDLTNLVEDPAEIPSCAAVSTVILYSESTYELRLPLAFAQNQDPCTRYYVDLPHLSADTTMPRGDADKVHALGAGFHAMAEFSWSGWRAWIDASPGTRNWELAGKAFRQRMIDAGYDVAAGDTWVINEFPSTTRTGAEDVWTHERSAVKGLFEGSGTPSKGVVFVAGMGQTLQNFAVYKPNVESWLRQSAWWNDMDSYVRFMSYEVYADPHYDCVIGSNVQADADNLNAFLEHLPRLAALGGSQSAAASAFLTHASVPLVQASWNSNGGFGNNIISLLDFEKFSRLQIYATHLWSAHHESPGRRIGFAWAPRSSTAAQEAELSSVIATSVLRSYPAGGFYNLGKYACAIDGSLDGCGCTVAGSYNGGWGTFASW